MKQMTLATARGFEKHNRATRKAEFLARMESLIAHFAERDRCFRQSVTDAEMLHG